MAFSREELAKLPNRINELFRHIKQNNTIDESLASEVLTICAMLLKLKTELNDQAALAKKQNQTQIAQLKSQTEKDIIKLWQTIHVFEIIGKKIKKADLTNIEHVMPCITVLAHLVTPRSRQNIQMQGTEFKTAQSSTTPAFSPRNGELTELRKASSRDLKNIKNAIRELEEKCENHPIIINRQPTERDKTWQTTAYGKSLPPAIIRCEKDKKLIILNLNPSDEQMMDAYVLSIKAMAQGRISNLTIQTEGLPFDLKIALIKAAKRHDILTTEKYESLSLIDYNIHKQGIRFDLGNGIQSHHVEEKPVRDIFPHKHL